jgi:hypothetical protein
MTTSADQHALAAVEAALFAYSTAGPRLDPRAAQVAAGSHAALRAQRDILHGWITASGGKPAAPPPAYELGPLPNVASARRVVLEAELALADAFAVLVHDDGSDRRVTVATWLSASAVRAVGWRAALGMTPTTVAFPGLSAPA